MVSSEAGQCTYPGGLDAEVLPKTPEGFAGTGFPVIPKNRGRMMIHLHCTGCGEDVWEQDVFDITGYRSTGLGQDEVSFICPLCGAASTSMRSGRIS